MRDQKEILNIFIGRTREANQVLFQSLAYQIPTETSSQHRLSLLLSWSDDFYGEK